MNNRSTIPDENNERLDRNDDLQCLVQDVLVLFHVFVVQVIEL